MTKFFVGLYNYFERHKVLFYLSLSVCILFMALFAAQVRFEENVTSFFPDTKDSQNAINVFENLKIKDKIMIMLSGKDGVADADSLIEAAETIKQDLQQQAEGTLIKEIFSKADENLINSAGDFVYDNLPLFLSDEDYQRLDTLLTAGNIAALMQKNYSNLISPAGFALKNYIMRDPLGLGSQTLKQRHKPTRSNDMQNKWRKDNSPQLFTHPIPVANTNRVGRQKHRATNCKSSHRCFLKSGSPAFSKSSTTNTLPVQSDLKASCVDVFFFPCCQNTIRLPLLSKPITKSFPVWKIQG